MFSRKNNKKGGKKTGPTKPIDEQVFPSQIKAEVAMINADMSLDYYNELEKMQKESFEKARKAHKNHDFETYKLEINRNIEINRDKHEALKKYGQHLKSAEFYGLLARQEEKNAKTKK